MNPAKKAKVENALVKKAQSIGHHGFEEKTKQLDKLLKALENFPTIAGFQENPNLLPADLDLIYKAIDRLNRDYNAEKTAVMKLFQHKEKKPLSFAELEEIENEILSTGATVEMAFASLKQQFPSFGKGVSLAHAPDKQAAKIAKREIKGLRIDYTKISRRSNDDLLKLIHKAKKYVQ